ncbi:hypothetical protein T459_23757 [Capsicum annuum]|uniref:Uncharacterized protein n=1 Tax=Capsicum annuum TaxID=4072 RepID=A0A2G2YTA6_CAPAN|nr:hypothetical protein T459_23757 [Capsicum annuum]
MLNLSSNCKEDLFCLRFQSGNIRAKDKEAMRIERLKRYEVSKVQGPEVQPHFLTGEEQFYIKKMAQKKSNYVPMAEGESLAVLFLICIYIGKGMKLSKSHANPANLVKFKNMVALEKSKYEQSLESLRRFIAIAEKELELYYRHVAVYDDPNNRIAYSILDDSRSTSEKQNGKIGEENYSSSESIASDLELSQIDDGCVV